MYRPLTLICAALVLSFAHQIVANEYIENKAQEYCEDFENWVEICEPNTYLYSYGAECAPQVCNPCCWNLYVTADYLFWQARSDELPYTISQTAIPGQLNAYKVENIEPGFASGVRIGLGTIPPCFDCWYFSAEWTYYHGNSTDTAQGGFLIPIWIDPTGNPFVTLAEADYTIDLNIADFSLERTFCPMKRLMLSSSIGLRGIWMDQDLNVNYVGGDLVTPILSKNSIDLKGGGIRAGLSTQWNVCYGISLLAWSNLDILWSHLDIFQRGIQTNGATRSSIKNAVRTVTPMFEVFLGANWERKIYCTNVCARVGWETQYFLNGVQINQYTTRDSAAPDDTMSAHQTGGLALGGLTAGVSVGF